MADKKFEELVREKRVAGLTQEQAEEVAKKQIAWDPELEKQEAEQAERAAKKPKAETKKAEKGEGESKAEAK